jgi:hypothetical protein
MSIDDDNPLPTEQNAEFHNKQMLSIDSIETIAEDTNEMRNSVKRLATGFTIAYIILFFPFFYMGLFSSMTFDNPRMTVPVGLSIMFFIFLIPFSIPISIYLMWSRYLRGQYQKTRIFCVLPFFTFIGVSFIVEVLRALLRYFVPL